MVGSWLFLFKHDLELPFFLKKRNKMKDITIFFAGDDIEDAFNGLPYDSFDSAESYTLDNGGKVFEAQIQIKLENLVETV
jgi:hypothetical protein